jgi:hypothetical protein
MRQKLIKPDFSAALATRKAAFLAALESAGVIDAYAVATAAAAVGVHRTTPYRWRARDPTFAAEWDALTRRRFARLAVEVEAERAARVEARERRNAELRAQREEQARYNFGHWTSTEEEWV